VAWEVEYTDEFGAWWEMLSEAEQRAVIPEADRLYDEHLEELREEGEIP
jgi:hypothetical protein